jgi:hypothetical protein
MQFTEALSGVLYVEKYLATAHDIHKSVDKKTLDS